MAAGNDKKRIRPANDGLSSSPGRLGRGILGKRTERPANKDGAADEWLARQNELLPESRYFSALGGELAGVVEVRGERARGRAAFMLRADMLYVLEFYPVDERLGRAASDVEAAWEAVTGSFAFIPKSKDE
jgi:hypothetical protein